MGCADPWVCTPFLLGFVCAAPAAPPDLPGCSHGASASGLVKTELIEPLARLCRRARRGNFGFPTSPREVAARLSRYAPFASVVPLTGFRLGRGAWVGLGPSLVAGSLSSRRGDGGSPGRSLDSPYFSASSFSRVPPDAVPPACGILLTSVSPVRWGFCSPGGIPRARLSVGAGLPRRAEKTNLTWTAGSPVPLKRGGRPWRVF